MSIYNITSRYASAFMEISDEKGTIETTGKDIDLVYNTLSASKELRKFLLSPIIKTEKKRSILVEIFKDKVTEETLNFILFVLKKNREEFLFPISKRFLELKDVRMGMVAVNIRSAGELSENQKDKMKTQLESYLSKKVRLNYNIDEKLIGGFIVRVKDTVIDASIVNQLKVLRQKFSAENLSLN
ncbi:MAG: ATP synthase F1 subunit delta [Melioribacteraceae bacterium]|nr:ATP synthase F1 subunit delta [Melioribacteraceae bacterium]MCF8356699.1 ATP synthase F1 subunit delta [Melioribacteraceae bacterium]MCF8393863.1 ATP synthase F1 subunit delta [Melioribacteraceae bacterium]MCF8418236.1 ATP synthase F1 subunit delta [Melioribacteraceae bacterium]